MNWDIDFSGKILSREQINNQAAEKFKDKIIEHEGSKAFLLVEEGLTEHGRPIIITQKDVRELQLAKGAILTGIKILLEKYAIEASEIKEVLLAGAFGNYLNPHSACVLGLLPKELESKIKVIGNAAGMGAKLTLLSRGEYERAARIGKAVEYVDLGSYKNFSMMFTESMFFE